jgi:hypothetical protein
MFWSRQALVQPRNNGSPLFISRTMKIGGGRRRRRGGSGPAMAYGDAGGGEEEE